MQDDRKPEGTAGEVDKTLEAADLEHPDVPREDRIGFHFDDLEARHGAEAAEIADAEAAIAERVAQVDREDQALQSQQPPPQMADEERAGAGDKKPPS